MSGPGVQSHCHESGTGTVSSILRTEHREQGLLEAASGGDLVIAGTATHHRLYEVSFGTLPDRLIGELECTVI